mgnify:CR=1 FL=1
MCRHHGSIAEVSPSGFWQWLENEQVAERKMSTVSIIEFAAQHGLRLLVRKRSAAFSHNAPYYAVFENADPRLTHGVFGMHGNGLTPLEAVQDYARGISNGTLRLSDDKKEISVPELHVPLPFEDCVLPDPSTIPSELLRQAVHVNPGIGSMLKRGDSLEQIILTLAQEKADLRRTIQGWT